MIIFSYYLIKVIFALGFFYSAYKFIKTDFLINYYLIFLLVFAALVLILFLIKTYFKKFLTSILPILYAIIFAIYTFEFFMFFNLSSVKLINHIPLNVLAKEKNLEWDNINSFEFYEILKTKIQTHIQIIPHLYCYQRVSSMVLKLMINTYYL